MAFVPTDCWGAILCAVKYIFLIATSIIALIIEGTCVKDPTLYLEVGMMALEIVKSMYAFDVDEASQYLCAYVFRPTQYIPM